MLIVATPSMGSGISCVPTPEDQLGPFYKSGAPVRSSVGKGYILTGTVQSSRDCAPIVQAKIEIWLTGPDGNYGDDYRATVYSDTSGAYSFESNKPKPYFGRPPHIHIRVSAEGFRTLITQHYPEKSVKGDVFDLVLFPVQE
ncbi:MAG: hypothetical protein JSU90_03670 [Nitrospiraceae bacterium]|nr:MAG: hypothetical protein JSU90_03670 [Nitrospiraceae bacterium]